MKKFLALMLALALLAVSPFAAVPGSPLEVVLAHTEEGQALAAAVEGFCGGFLPGSGADRNGKRRGDEL